MKFRCGLCMVSPSRSPFTGDRETVRTHLLDGHGIPEDSLETYLGQATEQTTLTT